MPPRGYGHSRKTTNMIKSKISSFAMAACLVGCGADSSSPEPDSLRSSILPLIAVDEEGTPQGLVGTFDAETNEVWLTDDVTDSAVDLAAQQGSTDTRIIVRFDEESVFLRNASAPAPELDVGSTMRACAFDPATETTWTIADVRVGDPAALDELSAFIPTALFIEIEDEDVS